MGIWDLSMEVKVPITDLRGPGRKVLGHSVERSEGFAAATLQAKVTGVHDGRGDGARTQGAGFPGDAAGPFGSLAEGPRDLVLGGES